MADEIDGAHLWFACVLFFLLGFLVEGEDGGSVTGNFLGAMADMFVYLWLATWWCWAGLLILLGLFLLIAMLPSEQDGSSPQHGHTSTKGQQKAEISSSSNYGDALERWKQQKRKRRKKSKNTPKRKEWDECKFCGCSFWILSLTHCCKQCYYEISKQITLVRGIES